jgi:hypothetical protein
MLWMVFGFLIGDEEAPVTWRDRRSGLVGLAEPDGGDGVAVGFLPACEAGELGGEDALGGGEDEVDVVVGQDALEARLGGLDLEVAAEEGVSVEVGAAIDEGAILRPEAPDEVAAPVVVVENPALGLVGLDPIDSTDGEGLAVEGFVVSGPEDAIDLEGSQGEDDE